MTDDNHALIDLDDSGLTVTDPAEDLRDRDVIDREGEEIGGVDGLLIDETERRVRFLQVGSGGFLGLGRKSRLIPVDAITSIEDDAVQVDTTRADVAGGPSYDPELAQVPDYLEHYEYYGMTAFWTPGYVYPALPPPGRRGDV